MAGRPAPSQIRFAFTIAKWGRPQLGALQARLRFGAKDFAIGNHPGWELFRCVYQMTKKPFVLGGLAAGGWFSLATVQGTERPVSPELVAFGGGNRCSGSSQSLAGECLPTKSSRHGKVERKNLDRPSVGRARLVCLLSADFTIRRMLQAL